jgi:hypothetical protein
MLSLDDFEPLALEHRPLFDNLYAKYPPRHSENVFTTLLSWQHYVKVSVLVREENILMSTYVEGEQRLRSPLGRPDADQIKDIVGLARREGATAIAAIEEEMAGRFTDAFPDLELTPNRDYFDYVYLSSDLAKLPGKNYLKIRNRLNRFNRKYEYTVEPVSVENFEETMTFIRKWCLWKDCVSNDMLENERIAVMYSMDNFFDLGLSGTVIRMGSEIEALSVYEALNPDTAIIHFEKAMPDFDGIYQAINNEVAKLLAPKYTFINRESDLGINGLREAKKRYHPHHLENIYFVERENLLKV